MRAEVCSKELGLLASAFMLQKSAIWQPFSVLSGQANLVYFMTCISNCEGRLKFLCIFLKDLYGPIMCHTLRIHR